MEIRLGKGEMAEGLAAQGCPELLPFSMSLFPTGSGSRADENHRILQVVKGL